MQEAVEYIAFMVKPTLDNTMRRFNFWWITLLIPVLLTGCSSLHNYQNSKMLEKKIAFDLKQLDADGLYGDQDSKRTMSYEFCIPADIEKANEVMAIDPSAVVYKSPPGRINCSVSEYLVMGDTFQKDYIITLQQLAKLKYVTRIVQAHFE